MNQNSESLAFSVEQFCKAHSICRATYYNLVKEGKGPRIMKIGRKPLISAEAAADWRKQMEAEAA